MAHVYEETITKARAALKVLNKQYGVKTTVSGKNTLCLNLRIKSGRIDFIDNYCEVVKQRNSLRDAQDVAKHVKQSGHIQVNHYYLNDAFSGEALAYLEKAKQILCEDHWDKSDIMTDYFNCSFYISINIGRWDKAYEFTNKN